MILNIVFCLALNLLTAPHRINFYKIFSTIVIKSFFVPIISYNLQTGTSINHLILVLILKSSLTMLFSPFAFSKMSRCPIVQDQLIGQHKPK